MVPPGFETRDSDFAAGLAQRRGSRDEPLLGSYQLRSSATDKAVDRFRCRLLDDIQNNPSFANRFSREATLDAHDRRDDVFQIHRGNASDDFWSKLLERGLMWTVLQHNRDEWAAVHPILGEAFMATVAAAAGDQGLEVVIDSSRVHAIASSRDEDAIYQTLFHDKSSAGISEPAMTLRLAHLVIVGGFDVSELSPEDLAKMSKNREALFDFRPRVPAKLVGQIPEMDSELRRDAYLKAAATAALDEWQESVRNMSGFARRLFGIGLLDKSERR
jgi:hypothetical protein